MKDDARETEPGGHRWRRSPTPRRRPARQARLTKPDPARPRGRMTVAGRVLDPDGKPVKGAVVELVASARTPWVAASEEIDQHTPAGPGPVRRRRPVPPRGAPHGVDPRLRGRRARRRAWLRPRLGRAEPRRRAARGRDQAPARTDRPHPAGRRDRRAGRRASRSTSTVCRAADDTGQLDGVGLGTDPPEGFRAWPRPVKTDDQGRIAVTRHRPRRRRQSRGAATFATPGRICDLDTASSAAGKEITLALEPARIIEGRVLAADTGRPIPNADRLGPDARQQRARSRVLHRQVPRRSSRGGSS